MKPSFYLVVVMNDIEPELHGPFDDEEARDNHAQAFRAGHGRDHGLYPLNISETGAPEIGAYAGGFFEEEA